jgi:hypothetical protein
MKGWALVGVAAATFVAAAVAITEVNPHGFSVVHANGGKAGVSLSSDEALVFDVSGKRVASFDGSSSSLQLGCLQLSAGSLRVLGAGPPTGTPSTVAGVPTIDFPTLEDALVYAEAHRPTCSSGGGWVSVETVDVSVLGSFLQPRFFYAGYHTCQRCELHFCWPYASRKHIIPCSG